MTDYQTETFIKSIELIRTIGKKSGLTNKDIIEGYVALMDYQAIITKLIKEYKYIYNFKYTIQPLISKTEDEIDINVFTNLSYSIKNIFEGDKNYQLYNMMDLMKSSHKKSHRVLFGSMSEDLSKIVDADNAGLLEYIQEFYDNQDYYLYQNIFGLDVTDIETARDLMGDVYQVDNTVYVQTYQDEQMIKYDSYKLFIDVDTEHRAGIEIYSSEFQYFWSKKEILKDINREGIYKISAQKFIDMKPELFI